MWISPESLAGVRKNVHRVCRKKKVLHRCNRETRVSCLSTGESRSIHMEMWKNSREKRKSCFARFSEFVIVNIGGDVADGIV